MSKTRVAQAATEHCEEVFEEVILTPLIARCIAAANQSFQYGAIWQRNQDEHIIRGLKGRVKHLLERLEESNEHSRKEDDHRYDFHRYV